MTNTINPTESALKQRQRRLKIKEQKAKDQELKDKKAIAEAKRIRALKQQQRNDQTDIFNDSWGREVEQDLVKQFEVDKGEYAFNVFGEDSSTRPAINPLTKISYQKQLSLMFDSKHVDNE